MVVRLLAALPHLLGLAGLALVVAGIWGAFGWEAGAVVAGSPFAGSWLYGEARRALFEWHRIGG